jgi:hypothetical protein
MPAKTLFILGAGFSRYAGMPLVQQLRQWVFDWLKRNGSSDPHVAVHLGPLPNWPEFPEGKFRAGLLRVDPADIRGFEEWMADLLKAADEYPACVQTYNVLRYACTKLLWEKQASLTSLPDAYLHFARQVRQTEGVVSLNWDLICELALNEASVAWGYSAKTAPIAVIKPHGSLNWVNHLQQADSGIKFANPAGMIPIAPQSTLSYDSSHPFEDPLLEYDWVRLRSITFPGDLEFVDPIERPRADADQNRLWDETEALIAKADTIVFIGYSLPRYDALALGHLDAACKGKAIVACNPSPDVLSEFVRVFGSSAVERVPMKFEESRFAEG